MTILDKSTNRLDDTATDEVEATERQGDLSTNPQADMLPFPVRDPETMTDREIAEETLWHLRSQTTFFSGMREMIEPMIGNGLNPLAMLKMRRSKNAL